MNQLSSQDINQLIEALQVWEKEPANSAFERTMLTTVFAAATAPKDKTEEVMLKAKRETDFLMAKGNQAVAVRREQSVMLQAKLLQIRNEVQKEEFASNA